MKIFKVLLMFGVAVILSAGHLCAQWDDMSQQEIKPILAAGKVYMLEAPEGNLAVSVGNEGILVIKDHSKSLSEDIKSALKKFKDSKVAIFKAKTNSHFNGEELRVLQIQNSTLKEDRIVYFVQSNVVYMGNNFVSGMFPIIDVDHDGDVEKFTDDISAILQTLPEDIKIIAGRGPLATKDDLADFKRMLIETTAIVRNKINAGRDLLTIQQEGLGEQWMSWGNRIISTDVWIKIIYDSLTRK